MRIINISKDLNLNETLLSKFVNFCCDRLCLNNDVTINLVSKRKPFRIKTTAHYNISDDECTIYCKHRAHVDICRSIAHELVHMMQNYQGLLDSDIPDIGGFHEDQANAVAGQLIKMFAQKTKEGGSIYE